MADLIETADGATIPFDYRGYGRAYPVGRRQIVVACLHLSDHEAYRWLNDSLAIGVGEVRTTAGEPVELVIEWEVPGLRKQQGCYRSMSRGPRSTFLPSSFSAAASRTSSLCARIPAMVGRTSTSTCMPVRWVGRRSG